MTAPTRRATATITVTIPMSLVPLSLSKNGRAHWATRSRDFRHQKEWVFWHIAPRETWPTAIMDINWRYARGRAPDDDNAISRVAAARDAFEAAGAVADDAHIRIGRVQFTRVPVGSEEVVVSLRRDEP
jgi:hypothetical protein